ncbi:Putative ribosomal protein S6 kinase alpha-1 [Zootermopsis nevadensis]|uniref:Putative ribosomal protein S6 kinase alpha-1 n=1 Tax=Zootermopsis nevadensis TaxID=136037 RepID=A0A067R476_ZOONE|nr:Putative ribosomal protein S6 kinase alpha-1 [Zootermopsis nevadensis]
MDYFPGGDMRQYISRQGKLTEVEVKYYLAEIILAIQHLHEMQIIHRDLKPENLLLDSSGHIAVADYGLCKFLSRNKAYSFCGTEGYLAPEMFSGRGYSKLSILYLDSLKLKLWACMYVHLQLENR